MAATNHVLGSIRLYHIPLNWPAVASLVWVFVDGTGRLGEPMPGGVFGEHRAPVMAAVALSACGLILWPVCIWRENLIFRTTTSWTQAADPAAEGRDGGGTIDLRATGRFRRGAGDALTLRDFPVVWEVSETGDVSLVTRVVDRGGGPELFGDSADRSGSWSLVLSRETLTGDVEDGLLYFGLSARPALRLLVPRESRAVILSLGHASEPMAFRRQLDEVLAESARRGAIFAAQLEAIATPLLAAAGGAPGTAEGTPAVAEKARGEIDWDKLIDLSP